MRATGIPQPAVGSRSLHGRWLLHIILLNSLTMAGHAQMPGSSDLSIRAERGDPAAQFDLGVKYHLGDGVGENYSEALKWFQKAADQGYAKAESEVGFMHERGHGTPVDYAEALRWYRKAAEQDVAMGQNNLGAMYEQGKGVARDPIEASRWFRKAAEQGLAIAQRNLGSLYADGKGVPLDYVEAGKWYQLAAAQNDSEARKRLGQISLRMTAEELAEARRRAAEFNKGKGLSIPHRSGSGFFITEDGYLLTNFHVVRDAARLMVRTARETYPAQLILADPANDIALLKVAGRFRPLPIGSSRRVRLGDPVFTVGFPNIELQGVAPKMTDGKVSSLTGENDDPRRFQISVAIQPGNSGGALVNPQGQVIGIVTARMTESVAFSKTGALPQSVNFAVKSAYALALLEALPELADKLREPRRAVGRKADDVLKEAIEAAALVLAD